ncbi:MAG: nucleotide sugar dehydrogenase [Legionellales bacterium]|nr:nucleotide sugar dehydrogenase [Legionellales bacterium]
MMKKNNNIQTVLVIGLGRIGLPQALVLTNYCDTVYGFTRDHAITATLKDKQMPFSEPGMLRLLQESYEQRFFVLETWKSVQNIMAEVDCIIFCVGTQAPSNEDILNHTLFDLSEYYALLDHVFADKTIVKKTISLIIHTTLPLGTTDKLKYYLENTHNLKESKDFFLAFVPERMAEGAAIAESQSLPKIIGTYSDAAFEIINELFTRHGGQTVRVQNPTTAEFCKLTDNSYRSTMFSYANELAMFANKLQININEVIHAVNQHYQRNHIPQPGFVSGYCLMKDPYIFELDFLDRNPERGFHSVWYYGRRTNDFLIDFVVNKIVKSIKNRTSACVTILGLSFKENVDDFRMSHAFKIMDGLIEENITHFKVYDPNLGTNIYTQLPTMYAPYVIAKSNQISQEIFSDVDAILIAVPHKELLTCNKDAKLHSLLQHTRKPCYLIDIYNIWDSVSTMMGVDYASFWK